MYDLRSDYTLWSEFVKSIRDMWDEVESNARIKVEDGSKTRYWKDEWHEKETWKYFSLTYTI